MHELITWLVDTIGVMGYPGIFLLMAWRVRSFPFPARW
jgi:hypothetical protein